MKEQFTKTILPALQKQLSVENVHAVPVMQKVTLNVGLGKGLTDKAYLSTVENTLRRISGQQPVYTKARKSIASFKIREGMPVGLKVTLRGPRMYDFVEKLVGVTFARIRDFRGIERTAVDAHGNFNFGFREHVAFPEIQLMRWSSCTVFR